MIWASMWPRMIGSSAHHLVIVSSNGAFLDKGRQYIVVAIGGQDHPAELVAFALTEVSGSTRPTQ
jgi:hypothetical protein